MYLNPRIPPIKISREKLKAHFFSNDEEKLLFTTWIPLENLMQSNIYIASVGWKMEGKEEWDEGF